MLVKPHRRTVPVQLDHANGRMPMFGNDQLRLNGRLGVAIDEQHRIDVLFEGSGLR